MIGAKLSGGVAILAVLSVSQSAQAFLSWSTSAEISKITFASCNDEDDPQELFDRVTAWKPNLFIWSGDVIYADTRDPKLLAQKYQKQLANPPYQRLLENVPVVGVWDDHDYAFDNSDKTNPIKEISKFLFLKFIGEPEGSPRWERDGIYASYLLGPPGRQVKVILLDVRYNRDSGLNPWGDMLGRHQWKWLEAELTNSPAQVHFIVTGTTALAPWMVGFENWNIMPGAYHRLFELFERTQPQGLMLISGDRHHAAALKKVVRGHEYHELMASGFNQKVAPGPGRWFITAMFGSKNISFAHHVGRVEIDWTPPEIKMDFGLIQLTGESHLTRKYVQHQGRWRLRP